MTRLVILWNAVLLMLSGAASAELVNTVDSLKIQDSFIAEVFAEGVGPARHMVAKDNGDIYVRLNVLTNSGGIAALRDTDEDGRADRIEYFESSIGTGLELHDGYLYFSSDSAVYRRKFKSDNELIPSGKREIVVNGFPKQTEHAAKAIAISPAGELFVNVGAPSNSCQILNRQRGSLGMNPCPLLENHGGIWRFPADLTGQKFVNGLRYASGLRNVVAMSWNTAEGKLYVVQHGRDGLHDLFPDLYTPEQSAELPAEEFIALHEGYVGAWPYAYFDHFRNEFVVAPEYGGDGQRTTDEYPAPLYSFPAHYAPNDLIFYTGGQFGERYNSGAVIAFHGSWNRLGFEQQGYQVSFLSMKDGVPNRESLVLMSGFEGGPIKASQEAKFRPMGLAQTPAGTLLVVDSVRGRIWQVQHISK